MSHTHVYLESSSAKQVTNATDVWFMLRIPMNDSISQHLFLMGGLKHAKLSYSIRPPEHFILEKHVHNDVTTLSKSHASE